MELILKILLPCAFEDIDAIQFPAFEGAGVDTEEVGDILLEKCFVISIPAELVRYFCNLKWIGEADIELFGLK